MENEHTSIYKKEYKKKIAVLPLIDKEEFESTSFMSTHELDINFFGWVSIRDALFDIKYKGKLSFNIKLKGNVPKNPRWSNYFNQIHHKLLKNLMIFSATQDINIDDYGILCIGYDAGDMQLGITGTIDGKESPKYATKREINEECSASVSWIFTPPNDNEYTSKNCYWNGFIAGLEKSWEARSSIAWENDCFCYKQARDKNMDDCLSSGYGSCKLSNEVFSREYEIKKE
jgi:hypothetical protein